MKAVWNGAVIAESDDIVTVENNPYFPAESLVAGTTEPSTHTSYCGWKGTAHYLSVKVGDQINKDAVWYYPQPMEAAANIKGRVAFWKGVKVTP